ncbi:VCBS repeat-containing protein [Microbacterium luteolum]|uniref:VCBS repeat-containing protein n=1 Tax=Microbacterium luteolum TaxID=69367 RepID=A0ABY7XNP3_MICLT|nr:VCBS repeat-containing protein [Microbacterium luteolum]WDM43756.1 VCBS repeat-containing protein [Microbacterium luteolum]
MSRRAPRSRNTLRISRLLTCFLAVSALIVGTVVPATAAAASMSSSISTAAKAAADPAAAGIAKTTLVGFNAGNIISDAVFTNKNSMTEAQIQAFFSSKVSRCLGGTDEDGRRIVCLKDFTISSVTRPADAYCNGYTGAANESAARIIYRVAQSCNINPQVLIVMLQKEQGLVTHSWPSAWRYDIALGQGCPDTAPCDPQYVGFFHQIYGAARQMQIYMEGKWFQWYAPGRTWNILYNPNAACGSSPVYIANKATSALYYYTPYQPNQNALNAGYGDSGDPCSAYGNRNFYNYFTDWFGSTQLPTSVVPTLSSIDQSTFVMGVDGAGDVYGYPYLNGAWGDRVKVGGGLTGIKKFFGVGDLDGDGRRDFIAIKTSGSAQVVRSNGTTTLPAPNTLPGDWSGVVLATPAGDFDGDGIPDLFTTDAAGRLWLWSGNDRGGFLAPRAVGSGWTSMNLITGNGDFDGDGRADLISRDPSGRLFLYSGDGNGSWKASKQIGNGWQGFTDIFNNGDFNGDGRADLLAVTSAGTLNLYRGLGGGTMSAGLGIGGGWQNFNASSAGPAVTARRSLPAGAGNLDGVPGGDIVGLTTSNELRVYGLTRDGNWGGTLNIPGAWGATDRLVSMGDFNGDGFSDVGQVDAAGYFYLHPGKAGGGFGARFVIGNGWGSFARVVGNLDFDGNRLPDVLAVDSKGDLILYRGNGYGGWANQPPLVIGQGGWSGFTSLFSAGDFDGDGAADLMGRSASGALMLYSTSGDGNWARARQIGQGWGGMLAVFSAGDIDGDRRVDVLAIAANGDMYLYRGDGQGAWRGDQPRINAGWQIMKQLF